MNALTVWFKEVYLMAMRASGKRTRSRAFALVNYVEWLLQMLIQTVSVFASHELRGKDVLYEFKG